jgi:hypothetical protein
MLLDDLLQQPAAVEGVSRTLVIGARHVKRIAAGAKLGVEVAR